MASLFIKRHASPIQEQVLFNVRLYGFSLSAKITLLQRKHLFCHQKQKYERNCFVAFFDSDKHTTTTISFSERHALDELQFSVWKRKNFQVKIFLYMTWITLKFEMSFMICIESFRKKTEKYVMYYKDGNGIFMHFVNSMYVIWMILNFV